MPKVDVYNMSGTITDSIELSKGIFGIEVNETAIHSVVVAQLSNARQGTQSAKTRSEVRGGGRKPWRQKGTGRARQGSTRNIQWTGGGVAFAPKPRDYSVKIPKKMKRLALKSALTTKVNESEFIVIDTLTFDEIKTKKMIEVLTNLKVNNQSTLIVLDTNDKTVIKSANNIESVKTVGVNTINVYDLIKYDKIVVTKEAVKLIEEVYA
ncbi:MAG: 50S ribosomal protein L4 [Clostridiales bacterium]|nr:50S ribosomal protein L4 [Clostridiales bacterium]